MRSAAIYARISDTAVAVIPSGPPLPRAEMMLRPEASRRIPDRNSSCPIIVATYIARFRQLTATFGYPPSVGMPLPRER